MFTVPNDTGGGISLVLSLGAVWTPPNNHLQAIFIYLGLRKCELTVIEA